MNHSEQLQGGQNHAVNPGLELRDYQRRAVDDVIACRNERPILVAPTGSGKTVMGATAVAEIGVPTLWLTHRRELVGQAADRLEAVLGRRVGRILAGEMRLPGCDVQVASVQTLARRSLPPAELIVVDECHHTPGESFRGLIDQYSAAALIGLTATPFRLDGKPLDDVFGKIIVAAHADELVAAGTLIEPKVYAPPAVDLRGVHRRGGDFEIGDLAAACDRPQLVGDIVETYKKRAAGKKAVVFAVNIAHSKHIIQGFVEAGIQAEHIDGSTPKPERAAALSRLASGETTILSNCNVVAEGWDLPALECAIIARPTASLCLHLQQIGRIMRSCPGKTGAIVLDHAGNFLRHGRVTRRLEYSLVGEVKAAESEGSSPGLVTCPNCSRMVLSMRSRCPECGVEIVTDSQLPETAPGELEEFGQAASSSMEEQEEFFRRHAEIAADRGFKPGWTLVKFKEQFGHWPVTIPVDGVMRLVNPHTADESIKLAVFEKFAAEGEAKGFKPGFAGARYREIFGVWPRFKRVVS